MRTRPMIKLETVVSATVAALAASLACGGSHQDANTPTNEGAPPASDTSSTTAPSGGDTSGTDTTGGGSSGMGAGGASPGNSTTTPPEGYAGSSGSQ